MEALIALENVEKRYAGSSRPALSGVDLRIFPGDRIGLVGGNGSGKTTLFRLILRFIFPDSGEIRFNGPPEQGDFLSLVGYVPERQEGLRHFTPRELFRFAGQMHQMDGEALNARIAEMLDMTGLVDSADRFLSAFSKGMIQRAQIGAALMHGPKVLLLDEPLSGLDPGGQQEVGLLLERLGEITLLMASHHLEQIEQFCEKVIFVKEGALVRQIDLREENRLRVSVDLDQTGIDCLEAAEIVFRPGSRDGDFTALDFAVSAEELQSLMAALHQAGARQRRLRTRSMLESLYQEYVGKGTSGP
ncbi:MAG TPA: ABC transporter ATP-binding protein [Calditrichia bacterium]|nr:ABC transporter ATP-binding protein [Calditrichia bacterium]